MSVKAFLSQAFFLDQRINSKLNILSSLKEMATKASTIMQSNEISHMQNIHKTEDIITNISNIQDEIRNDIDELINQKKGIMLAIHNVKNPEFQTLLELRYICYRSWEEIADQMHCSISNIFKVHAKALQNVTIPKSDS